MKKAPLLLVMGLLSGCSFFATEESLPLYTLQSGCTSASHALQSTLAVDVPTCEASLDTQRIAITPSPYQRSYLADGQWPERLPKALQHVFIETFSKRWGGQFVDQVGTGLETSYILQSSLQDFSLGNLDKAYPEVRLKILFKLVDMQSRKVLGAQLFCETVPATCLSMSEVVSAFNKALQTLVGKSIPWIENTLSSSKP